MKHNEFTIGQEFYTTSGKWKCTDIGTRAIVAIKLNDQDESWNIGPPYATSEIVFDEYDLPGCNKTDHEKK